MQKRTKIVIATAVIAAIGVAGLTAIGHARDGHGYGYGHGYGHGPGYMYGAGGHHGGFHMARFRRQGRGGFHGARLFETFDTNKDDKVTSAEVETFRKDRLARFDTDKNGKLSLTEYQALWADAMRQRMVDRFQALDDDGDASVSPREFGAPLSRVIERLDRNGDGQVTRDELRRRRGPRHDRDDD